MFISYSVFNWHINACDALPCNISMWMWDLDVGLTLSDVKLKAQIPLGKMCTLTNSWQREVPANMLGLIEWVKIYIICLLGEVRDWNVVH